MRLSYRFPVLVFAVLQWSCSTPPVLIPESRASLLACVRDGTTGSNSPEDRDGLSSKFIAFSNDRKQATLEGSTLGYEKCVADLAANPFCSLLLTDSLKVSTAFAGLTARGKHKLAGRILRFLKKADLEEIRKADGEALRAAFKLGFYGKNIDSLSQKLLSIHGDCDLATVNLLVGARAEESSPEPEFLDTALAHYERAAACPTSGLDGEKALYRTGLLQYWRGKRELADRDLRRVVAWPNGEIKARALFWLQQIHQEAGDVAVAQGFRATLKAEFPFSLHNLIAHEKVEVGRAPEGLLPDSVIQYRSKARPDLDSWVAATEFLIREGHNDQASHLLNSITRKLEGTEPSFQLYLAVLFNRADDYLGKFRLLSTLFRNSPQLVSQPALELYYPKKTFHQGAPHLKLDVKLDEFLVLSLIRQESAFNKNARSSAGAIGLMQIMPATARRIERRTRRADLYQVDRNVRIGSEYFSRLLKRFDGDAELALAAYNAGSKHVEDWLKRYPVENRILFLDLIPFKETREYVAAITRNYYWYTRLYSKAVAVNGPVENKGRLFKLLN